jgi:hypothetical protein
LKTYFNQMKSPLLVIFQQLVLLINCLVHLCITRLLQQMLDQLFRLFTAPTDNPCLLFSANL